QAGIISEEGLKDKIVHRQFPTLMHYYYIFKSCTSLYFIQGDPLSVQLYTATYKGFLIHQVQLVQKSGVQLGHQLGGVLLVAKIKGTIYCHLKIGIIDPQHSIEQILAVRGVGFDS